MLDKKINLIQSIFDEAIKLKMGLSQNHEVQATIVKTVSSCVNSLKQGGKIVFFGNGGSFADAQHLSGEFTSRFMFDRPGLASLVLGANSSSMSAIGNDYGYEEVFAREIEALVSKKDFLISITTSGKSLNILKGVSAARKKKIPLLVLTGNNGGDIPSDIDKIIVPSSNTARIQEVHITIGHIICQLVEAEMFPRN